MIVAAAIKTADGRVWALPRPARHADIFAHISTETRRAVRGEEKGFLACSMCVDRSPACTEQPHGLFLRRGIAEFHAREVGQLDPNKPLVTGVLSTEDLW